MNRALEVALVVGAGYALLVGAAWLFQRRLMYLPMGAVPAAGQVLAGTEEVTFTTSDGLRLGGWFVPARGRRPEATVMVLNGNAGNRSYRAPLAHALSEAGFSVFLWDYRGFGGNPGRPSEAGVVRDAAAARDYLGGRPDVDPSRIAYFGESLGSAVAVAAAAERPPAALVLRSPFTSMVALGRRHYPFLPVSWLLRDRFPAAVGIRSVRSPTLVVAGDRDSIVPLAESRALFEASGATRKRFVAVAGADHNDYELLAGEELIGAVTGFLRTALGSPGVDPGDPGLSR